MTIYDVKDLHISNEWVSDWLGKCNSLHQYMEICRSRWLQKLENMNHNRGPKKNLLSWIHKQPRPIGRPQQTVRKSLSNNLTKTLGIISDNMNDWIELAKNKDE